MTIEEADTVDIDDHTVLDETELKTELLEGGTLFSQSDMSSVARKLAIYDQLISDAIKAERKRLSEVSGDPDRTIGVEVQFQRYTLPTSTATAPQPVLITKEKPNRGDTVITCYTDGATVYIGLHSGIGPGSPDTVAIVGSTGGTARVIKTRRALWAVASQLAEIDIQEEFA